MLVKAIDEALPPLAPSAISPNEPRLPLQGFEDSSIAKAAAEAANSSYCPSKPNLDPPANPIHHTIEYLERRTESVYGKWMDILGANIERQFNDIHAMNVEQSRQMDEALEASKQVSFWGILEDLASTVSGAMAFALGTSAALAGSPILGGTLIASGILSISNLAFKHSRIWDWTADQIAGSNKQLREQVRSYLPSAVGLAATALTMAAGYGAWKYAAQTGLQMTGSLINTTTDIADGLIKYKSGTTNADHRWKLADLNALQTTTDISKMDLENMIEDVQEFHEHQTDMHATIGKILEERDQAIQTVQQPV